MASEGILSNSAVIVTSILLVASVFGMIVTGEREEPEEGISVVVSILPQAEFVREIGGENVRVVVMVPQGEEPHTYEPTTAQIQQLESSHIYFKVGSGVDFEISWMDRFQAINPSMSIIDGSSGIDLISMSDHSEDGDDPHIWLSPINAKKMVENFRDGLMAVDPNNGSYYEDNAAAYIAELGSLDAAISNGFDAVENRKFLSYHPAWGYFAERYDLEQIQIEEEGKEPTAYSLAKIIDQAIEEDIEVVLISPAFSTRAAHQIANEIGGVVIITDPLAGNYIENMRSFSEELSGWLG